MGSGSQTGRETLKTLKKDWKTKLLLGFQPRGAKSRDLDVVLTVCSSSDRSTAVHPEVLGRDLLLGADAAALLQLAWGVPPPHAALEGRGARSGELQLGHQLHEVLGHPRGNPEQLPPRPPQSLQVCWEPRGGAGGACLLCGDK